MIKKMMSFITIDNLKRDLSEDQQVEVDLAFAKANCNRIRIMGISIFLLEMALIAFYDIPKLMDRSALLDDVALQYFYAHLLLFLFSALGLMLIDGLKGKAIEDYMGTINTLKRVGILGVLTMVAYVSGLDQLISNQIIAYVVVFVIASVFMLVPPKELWVYGVAHFFFIGVMYVMQSDPATRFINITNGTILFFTCILISWYSYRQFFIQSIQSIELKASHDKLSFLANHDSLTGLPNRRHFEELLEKADDYILGSRALVLMDLDNFKQINDMYGHSKADDVLFAFSRVFESSISEKDLVARWGGEEFIFFIARKSNAEIMDLIEDIRLKMERLDFLGNGQTFRVTGSFGVKFIEPDCNDVLKRAYTLADKALYLAKDTGKNKIIISEVKA